MAGARSCPWAATQRSREQTLCLQGGPQPGPGGLEFKSKGFAQVGPALSVPVGCAGVPAAATGRGVPRSALCSLSRSFLPRSGPCPPPPKPRSLIILLCSTPWVVPTKWPWPRGPGCCPRTSVPHLHPGRSSCETARRESRLHTQPPGAPAAPRASVGAGGRGFSLCPGPGSPVRCAAGDSHISAPRPSLLLLNGSFTEKKVFVLSKSNLLFILLSSDVTKPYVPKTFSWFFLQNVVQVSVLCVNL